MSIELIKGMVRAAARTSSQVNVHITDLFEDYVPPNSLSDVRAIRDRVDSLLPGNIQGFGAALLQPLQAAIGMQAACDVRAALEMIDQQEPASLYIYPTGTDLIGLDQFERYSIPLTFVDGMSNQGQVFYTAFRDRRSFQNSWEFGRVIWFNIR